MAADMPFTDDDLAVLKILLATPAHPVCPNCGQRAQDPRSINGWCVVCDSRRERQLESKRRWWRQNRGSPDHEVFR